LSAPSTQLDTIRVRFATFRDRSIDERAAYAELLASLPADERVLVDTCHRVELVSIDATERPGPAVAGRDAIRRVFEVVAGFDSAVVAEEQLLGQVRAAYEASLASGASGPILNELFRRALRFGRRVRSHARPGSDRSLADRGARWLIDGLGTTPGAILVVGTGDMGRRTAALLAGAGHRITVTSQSLERAQRAVAALPAGGHRAGVGTPTPEAIATSDAVVLAVRPRAAIVDATHVTPRAPRFVLDLSTPAAVSRSAALALGERLLALDRLGALGSATPVLDPRVERRLRRELDLEVARFQSWVEARGSSDAVAVLRDGAETLRRRHLDRLVRRARLAPDQAAAVDAASAAMLGELLHGPSVELRRGGADADLVRRLFRLGS